MTPDTKDRLAGEGLSPAMRRAIDAGYASITSGSTLTTANKFLVCAIIEGALPAAIEAYDPDQEQRMVEALRGALVVIDTLPWPSEAEAGRKVLDALTKRRAAIVAALAPFNAIEKASP